MRPLDRQHGWWPLVRPQGVKEFLRAVAYWLTFLGATVWFVYVILVAAGVTE